MEVINNPQSAASPAPQGDSGGGLGFLVGAILLIILVLALLYYGVPVMRNLNRAAAPAPAQPSQNMPATPPAVPNVSIPEEVDINVNNDKKEGE